MLRLGALTCKALRLAGRRLPGIDVGVRVDPADRSVTVRLRAPLDLPLRIPGSPRTATIGASSTAAVTVQ